MLVEDKVVIIEGRLSIEKDSFGSDDDESDTREIAKLMARNISEVGQKLLHGRSSRFYPRCNAAGDIGNDDIR